MKTIKTKKGNHYSLPFIFQLRWKAKKVEKEFTFTKDSVYNLDNEDQKDWNKLTGVSFNISALKNSVMVGWRYNVETNNFELCLYFHVNGSFNPPSKPLLTVQKDETFKVVFDFDKSNKTATLELSTSNKTVKETIPFLKFGINRTINTWFGGNQKAPNNIKIIQNK